jgi:hypothetical protein
MVLSFLISNFRLVLNAVFFLFVIPRRLNFISRRFRTLCLFHPYMRCTAYTRYMKMEHTECFETSAYKIQTLGNYPKERIHDPTSSRH